MTGIDTLLADEVLFAMVEEDTGLTESDVRQLPAYDVVDHTVCPCGQVDTTTVTVLIDADPAVITGGDLTPTIVCGSCYSRRVWSL